MRKHWFVIALFLLPGSGFAAGSKDAPSWVQDVSSRRLPAYNGKFPAAVLL